ncbi:ATP-grasp fold amidoligase family protein [Gramella jeungdoensis]|uniref:ATP-grasp fold amidoligase family protein n=1 Tax=Gramella jeungdoensis TaxID=708091 RepID=UPI001956BA46|nr:ATP-grasp fold amidoligase family protein [Gramella jeungdoensis]
MNLTNPKKFNEKIIYLKLYNRFENAHLLVDKFEVRSYIENIIGNEYLVPIYGAFDNVDEIEFEEFPKKFVLKANQSSGHNIIVKEKNSLNIVSVKKMLKAWLLIDYSFFGEWQYKGIKNKILVEKFIENSDENPLLDYKFFCFNGEPMFIQIDIDRFTNHSRNFYDLNWSLIDLEILYPKSNREIPIPNNLVLMIKLVRKIALDLSNKMSFVRIDFYDHNNQVYFGEITFHPEGGCGPIIPKVYDNILGDLLNIQIV